MALATADSGTQTATISTEHSLSTQTNAKTYVLQVDTINMALGDKLELRIKEKVLTGGTARVAYFARYVHVQAQPIKISIPCPSMFSLEATLKQTAGTGRNFDWALLTLD